MKQRERYKAKKEGYYQPAHDKRIVTLSAPMQGGKEPRFIETRGTVSNVVHWMPKEEEWWVCEQCGAEFIKKDGEWKFERFT